MSEVTKNILYTLYAQSDLPHAEETANLRQWVANNGLDSAVSQIEPGPYTTPANVTVDYCVQFGITAPSLVKLTKSQTSDAIECTKIAEGSAAILALTAEQITALKNEYDRFINGTGNKPVVARRIG